RAGTRLVHIFRRLAGQVKRLKQGMNVARGTGVLTPRGPVTGDAESFAAFGRVPELRCGGGSSPEVAGPSVRLANRGGIATLTLAITYDTNLRRFAIWRRGYPGLRTGLQRDRRTPPGGDSRGHALFCD